MLKIAVTGANGFIGRYITDELAKHSVEVTLVVRHQVPQCIETDKVKIVECDIYKTHANVFKLLREPDVLIHLAWGGLPDYSSLHHFEYELPMQYQFLKRLLTSGVQSLVVAGTCFEYGMHSGSLDETIPALPTNPYGFAKHVLQQQLVYLQTIIPFSLTWARLFYLYGKGQASNSLFPQLCQAVKQDNKIFNMSGGEQLRDYLPVETVANSLVSMALARTNFGIVNICSGKPISIRRLVEGWIKENNWDIQLNLGYYPYPDYEPMAFWGDNSKFETHMKQL